MNDAMHNSNFIIEYVKKKNLLKEYMIEKIHKSKKITSSMNNNEYDISKMKYRLEYNFFKLKILH